MKELINNNIRFYRLKLGMTQAELAKTLGVGQQTVCLWESYRNTPHMSNLKKLASVFGCNVGDLFN